MRVVISVSGGLDSITLMHLLARTQRAHRGVLEVVSIDHGLRSESRQEVLFVKQQADALDTSWPVSAGCVWKTP